MSEQVFRFKQFDVEQPRGGFRINTDGVLIGALASHTAPAKILDVGTGTGVIALMMAQRYPRAAVTAIDNDRESAETAAENFRRSRFSEQLVAVPASFQDHLKGEERLNYDLIVANPPFFLNSIPSSEKRIAGAKHTQFSFFHELTGYFANQLAGRGLAWLILPVETAAQVINNSLAMDLFVNHRYEVTSFEHKPAHRAIFSLGLAKTGLVEERVVIYDRPNKYSRQFAELLGDFFTIF